jgi:carbon storage regulator
MMLVLSRKEGERIVVGSDILITVIESRGNRVRLGISAPKGIPINRQEVSARLAREEAADSKYESCRDEAPFSV